MGNKICGIVLMLGLMVSGCEPNQCHRANSIEDHIYSSCWLEVVEYVLENELPHRTRIDCADIGLGPMIVATEAGRPNRTLFTVSDALPYLEGVRAGAFNTTVCGEGSGDVTITLNPRTNSLIIQKRTMNERTRVEAERLIGE
jgi:hypothetical protein